MVYAIQDYEGGPVKIGYVAGGMDSVERRLVALQCGNPVKLHIAGTIEGGVEIESLLHRWMRRLRVRGEWFDVPVLFCDCTLAKMVARAQREIGPMQNGTGDPAKAKRKVA